MTHDKGQADTGGRAERAEPEGGEVFLEETHHRIIIMPNRGKASEASPRTSVD